MPENPTPTPEEQVLQNALNPKKVEIDGQVVEQHSVKDQIDAVRFAASQQAATNKSCGIRFFKMIPPGGA